MCEEAEDGAVALEQLAMTPVDLVWTDLNMPRTNGLELMWIAWQGKQESLKLQ